MKKSVLVGFAFALAACGPINQDPLKGKDNNLRNGVPVEKPGTKPDPMISEAVRIDTRLAYFFQEDQENAYEIQARVLVENYEVSIDILNMEEFPEATYDGGVFRWAPQIGFTGSLDIRKMTLRLQATAIPQKEGDRILVRFMDVDVTVNKTPPVPEIVAIEDIPNHIRENDYTSFTIRVRDLDAAPVEGKMPTLEFAPTSGWGVVNLAPFLTVQRVTPVPGAGGEYNMNVRIHLQNAELTRDTAEGEFSVTVRSRVGRVSKAKAVRLRIFNYLVESVSNWTANGPVQFVMDVETTKNFQIMNPKFEGRISIIKLEDIPMGGRLNCVNLSDWLMDCSFNWKPTVADVNKQFTLALRMEGKSTASIDTRTVTNWIYLRLNVVPTPAPTPTPTLTGGKQ